MERALKNLFTISSPPTFPLSHIRYTYKGFDGLERKTKKIKRRGREELSGDLLKFLLFPDLIPLLFNLLFSPL